jgi:hypothetical protein
MAANKLATHPAKEIKWIEGYALTRSDKTPFESDAKLAAAVFAEGKTFRVQGDTEATFRFSTSAVSCVYYLPPDVSVRDVLVWRVAVPASTNKSMIPDRYFSRTLRILKCLSKEEMRHALTGWMDFPDRSAYFYYCGSQMATASGGILTFQVPQFDNKRLEDVPMPDPRIAKTLVDRYVQSFIKDAHSDYSPFLFNPRLMYWETPSGSVSYTRPVSLRHLNGCVRGKPCHFPSLDHAIVAARNM